MVILINLTIIIIELDNSNPIAFMYLFQYVNELSNTQSKLSTLVENIGVEPMTSCVQGRRSSQLS